MTKPYEFKRWLRAHPKRTMLCKLWKWSKNTCIMCKEICRLCMICHKSWWFDIKLQKHPFGPQPGNFLMWQRLHELQNWIMASLLQTLETSQNEATGLKKALSTVSETGWFTRTELAPWSSSNAFVPADICELAYKLIQHCFLLFLLHSTYKQHATIQYDKKLNPPPFSKKILRQ